MNFSIAFSIFILFLFLFSLLLHPRFSFFHELSCLLLWKNIKILILGTRELRMILSKRFSFSHSVFFFGIFYVFTVFCCVSQNNFPSLLAVVLVNVTLRTFLFQHKQFSSYYSFSIFIFMCFLLFFIKKM